VENISINAFYNEVTELKLEIIYNCNRINTNGTVYVVGGANTCLLVKYMSSNVTTAVRLLCLCVVPCVCMWWLSCQATISKKCLKSDVR